jgi:hypothetical protein
MPVESNLAESQGSAFDVAVRVARLGLESSGEAVETMERHVARVPAHTGSPSTRSCSRRVSSSRMSPPGTPIGCRSSGRRQAFSAWTNSSA